MRRSRVCQAAGSHGRARRRAGARAGLAAAVCLVLAACTGPSHQVGESVSPPSPGAAEGTTGTDLPGAAVEGLGVEIRQSRSDWAARVVQLRVVNATGGPLEVAAAALTTPTAEGTATWEASAPRRVPEGRHRDLSVPLGPARCPADPDGAANREVALEVTDAQGRSASLRLVPDDPQGHLERIHREDCAARALARAADIRLSGFTTEERDGTLIGRLELSVTPLPGGPALGIDRIDGTVLLAPLGGTSWSLPELAPVTGPTTVRLELVPARCDPHAVAEDKRGTFLGLHTTLDGAVQPVVHLDSGDELRGALHDYLADACGWG